MLSELSQTERQVLYDFFYIQNQRKTQTQTKFIYRWVVARGKRQGMTWMKGVKR